MQVDKNQTNTIANIAELYQYAAQVHRDRPAFATRNRQKQFVATSFAELYSMGCDLATALIEIGVLARDHVGLLADNRLEWIVADCAIQLCGAADVPRGSDVTDHDIQYILKHADARVVFVENADLLKRVQANLDHLPQLEYIIVMDWGTQQSQGMILNMQELLERGRTLRLEGDGRVVDRIKKIQPDDLFTIIYTSGTTGVPKGVMLSHRNILSQIKNLPIKVDYTDRVLSILPVWHIFERVFEMVTVFSGTCQYYSSVRHIREDLSLVRPTFMASAPRLWENVYNGIKENLRTGSAIKKALFHMANFCARQVRGGWRYLRGNQLDLVGRNFIHSAWLGLWKLSSLLIFLLPFLLLDAIVLRKIRAATGGKLRGSVSGGGALPLHVDEFFNNIGIPVLEGYGLTETSPVIAARTFEKLVVGSVGPIFPETDIRLVDLESSQIIYPPKSGRGRKGEIHVRGPQVMLGYYKNPEATQKVLKDGWFNTGDLGVMTYNNTLKIVGRSKETIVLLSGENVEPVPIENRILQSPLIDQVMVVGQDQKFLSALVVPALAHFQDYGRTYADLARNPEVQQILKQQVKDQVHASNGFKAFERIGEVRVLQKAFEPGDELSAKQSVKRHVVTDKYQDLIASIYE